MKHKHHIVPKHMGGSDDPSNLVELSVEEHAEAHRKLWEEHGKIEDFYAWQGLSGIIPKAELIKQLISALNTGREVPPERRKAISEKLTGRTLTTIHKERIGAKHKGKIVSEETRRKMALAKIGNKNAIGNRSSRVGA